MDMNLETDRVLRRMEQKTKVSPRFNSTVRSIMNKVRPSSRSGDPEFDKRIRRILK